jgi:hypothetical protein
MHRIGGGLESYAAGTEEFAGTLCSANLDGN